MNTIAIQHPGLFTLLLTFLTVVSWAQQDETTWTLKKEQDGLKVFLRKNASTGINDVRLQFSSNAPLECIVAVLRNPKNFPNWVYNCKETRHLEMAANGDCIYYSRINFPWPIQDRDVVARSRLTRNERSGEIVIQSVNLENRLPKTDKVVRIPYMASGWIISPQSDGTQLLVYELSSDPGGSLPSWLINMAVDKGPIHTVKALRAELEATAKTTTSPASSFASGY